MAIVTGCASGLAPSAANLIAIADVIVNNAAIAGNASKPLLETSEADWDAIMSVNLRGVFLCCRRAIGEMIEQEPAGEVRGRVIVACGDARYVSGINLLVDGGWMAY